MLMDKKHLEQQILPLRFQLNRVLLKQGPRVPFEQWRRICGRIHYWVTEQPVPVTQSPLSSDRVV
jgi:hypothetical protein